MTGAKLKSFQFRELPPKHSDRMASDRYAGWIGQILRQGSVMKMG